jgi:hypothetical protein
MCHLATSNVPFYYSYHGLARSGLFSLDKFRVSLESFLGDINSKVNAFINCGDNNNFFSIRQARKDGCCFRS